MVSITGSLPNILSMVLVTNPKKKAPASNAGAFFFGTCASQGYAARSGRIGSLSPAGAESPLRPRRRRSVTQPQPEMVLGGAKRVNHL